MLLGNLVKPFAKLGEFWFILAGTSEHTEGRGNTLKWKQTIGNKYCMDGFLPVLAMKGSKRSSRLFIFNFVCPSASAISFPLMARNYQNWFPKDSLCFHKPIKFPNLYWSSSWLVWRCVYRKEFSQKILNSSWSEVAAATRSSVWIFHDINIWTHVNTKWEETQSADKMMKREALKPLNFHSHTDFRH